MQHFFKSKLNAKKSMMNKMSKTVNRIHVDDQIKSLYIRILLLPSFPISLCHTQILKLALVILFVFQVSLCSIYITCPQYAIMIHSYTDTCTLTYIYSSFFIQLLFVRGFLEYSPQIQHVDNTFSEFLCILKYCSFAQTSEEYLAWIQYSQIAYFSLGNLQISSIVSYLPVLYM